MSSFSSEVLRVMFFQSRSATLWQRQGMKGQMDSEGICHEN